jgi:dTDP_gluc_dehyt: dTDP-glucose 4,6-dehydratase
MDFRWRWAAAPITTDPIIFRKNWFPLWSSMLWTTKLFRSTATASTSAIGSTLKITAGLSISSFARAVSAKSITSAVTMKWRTSTSLPWSAGNWGRTKVWFSMWSTARVTTAATPSTRQRFTRNWAGCRKRSLPTASKRPSLGTWKTKIGGSLSSPVNIRPIIKRCTAIAV